MSKYRAYVIGSDNLVAAIADYEFENDDHAIGSVAGLWSGTRRVAKIVAGAIIPSSAGSPPSDAESETPQRSKKA